MVYVIILLIISSVVIYFGRRTNVKYKNFPSEWRDKLNMIVSFYQMLNNEKKQVFERDILNFLNDVTITGINTTVNIDDKLLVASSAVIPVFGFPEWEYTYLDEVLLYPGAFNKDFGDASANEYITGMVGNGPMEGKMILSKPSLHLGFSNDRDKKNVGIHEFIHLIDKEDGIIDGLPLVLNDEAHAVPWLELIRKKTLEVIKKKSDINPYGTTNTQEFLAVAGEYFFERPHLLKSKHPELYEYMTLAFNQNPDEVIPKTKVKRKNLSRNSSCICNSGKKYKHCCLKN